jgi:hypothetical protein
VELKFFIAIVCARVRACGFERERTTTVMHSAVLYCNVLYSAVLCWSILWYVLVQCAVELALNCTILHYTELYISALTALHYTLFVVQELALYELLNLC